MHEAMKEMAADGMSRGEIRKRLQAMTVGEVRDHPESARQYMAMWERGRRERRQRHLRGASPA